MKLYTFLFKKYKFGAYKFVCIYIRCSVLYFVCTALVASHTDKEPCTTSGCFPFLHWLPASTMAAVCRQGFVPFRCFMCWSDALSSWVWLLWLRVMFPVLPTSFLSMGEQYCVLLMSQTCLSISQLMDASGFCSEAVVNHVAVNIGDVV